jgi:hypothetical protein
MPVRSSPAIAAMPQSSMPLERTTWGSMTLPSGANAFAGPSGAGSLRVLARTVSGRRFVMAAIGPVQGV